MMIKDLFDPNREAGYEIEFPLNNGITLPMIWCPPGKFMMGLEYDGPMPLARKWYKHPVILTRGFWIAQTLLTQEQWRAIMKEDLHWFKRQGPDTDRFPALVDSWPLARDFCAMLTRHWQTTNVLTGKQSVNLPTEAQWEYACRAGTESTWYFGEDEEQLQDHAWYQVNSHLKIHPVKQKQANPWGLYDVYGNLSEWCLDNLYMYPQEEVKDPVYLDANSIVKVIRGGSAYLRAFSCQSAARSGLDKDNYYVIETGLRIVCIERPPRKR